MDIEAEDLNQDENIDLAELANTDQGNKDDKNEVVQLSDTEQKAFDQGWRPKDDFEGPEDNWKTAKEYVRDGEFLATIKDLNQRMDKQGRDFDVRLENSNKLHEARRKTEISNLKAQQREAVSVSDTEAFDHAQTQIDDLEKVVVEDKPAVNNRPVVDDWLAKNPWMNDKSSDKTNFANDIWNGYVSRNPNSSDAEVLAHVDAQLAKLYPVNNENPRRNQQNTNETPAKRGKKGSKSLTMGDLTQDEKNEYTQIGSMFKDEAAFLKAVKDTRAN